MLAAPLPEILRELKFFEPTPVQRECLPLVLEGRDVLATAQTGTGKTAAFVLPLLSKRLENETRPCLIVTPTREIAEQIGQVLEEMTARTPQIRLSVIIGGAAYPKQIASLTANPLFVVGTPGRLLDQARLGHLKLAGFGALVIDEADRLLDMGFEPQMNEIVAQLPRERQTMLFSATLADEVAHLAARFLKDPARVAIGAPTRPVDKIKQDVIHLGVKEKDDRLVREIDKVKGSIIVFVKTKYKAEQLARFLDKVGHDVTRLHGDRTQAQRSGAVAAFRDGSARILVATDIAARGLDIPNVEHVINYDLPLATEDYIHRIGRTARAGAEGHSIAFVTPEENLRWAQIYKLIHGKLPPRHELRGANGAQTLDRKALAYARKHGLDVQNSPSGKKTSAKVKKSGGGKSSVAPASGPSKTSANQVGKKKRANSQDGKLRGPRDGGVGGSRAEKRAAKFSKQSRKK